MQLLGHPLQPKSINKVQLDELVAVKAETMRLYSAQKKEALPAAAALQELCDSLLRSSGAISAALQEARGHTGTGAATAGEPLKLCQSLQLRQLQGSISQVNIFIC